MKTTELDPSKPLKDGREENFVKLLLEAKKCDYECYMEAGFKVKNKTVAQSAAPRLFGKVRISARLNWLKQQAMDKTIAGLIERKQFLTKILREVGGRETSDYVVFDKDGTVRLVFDKDSPRQKAIQSVKTRVEIRGEGEEKQESYVNEIRFTPFSDALTACDQLNKLDGSYKETAAPGMEAFLAGMRGRCRNILDVAKENMQKAG